jgi:hypothetical protein
MEVHPREPMVRILAARFPDLEHASQALESLHDRLDPSVEVEIAPLAADGESDAGDALLAGHFEEDQKPHVEEIVRQAGGEIVADVDERWTRPRQRVSEHVEEGGGFTY